MNEIDTDAIDDRLRKSLNLLETSFHRSVDGGGGWYHHLETPTPGPTATALAVAAFLRCDLRPAFYDEALDFLRRRQVKSADPKVDGGWANNTSMGHPVVEATGWVTWTLANARCSGLTATPDIERGYRWLVSNQNDDGGWGSFIGTPSRVWLTCVATLGVAQVNPYDSALDSAIDWLMAQRNGDIGGWGPSLGEQCTATHTGFALYTIGSVRTGWSDQRLLDAFEWLTDHLDTAHIDDHHARVESYNVHTQGSHGPELWATNLLHYGLPWSVSALLRHPTKPPCDAIADGLTTILRTQLPLGAWPNIQGASGTSIWALWPFVEALSSARRLLRLVPNSTVLMADGIVLIRRKDHTGPSLQALIRAQRRFSLFRLFGRYWPAVLVMACVLTGLIFTWLGKIALKDYLLGLIVPIGIYVVQEARARKSKTGF